MEFSGALTDVKYWSLSDRVADANTPNQPELIDVKPDVTLLSQCCEESHLSTEIFSEKNGKHQQLFPIEQFPTSDLTLSLPQNYEESSDLDNSDSIRLEEEGIKLFPCVVCKREFLERSALDIHNLIHADGKCDICGKVFKRMRVLLLHKKEHAASKRFLCDMCSKSFNKICDLLTHKGESHKVLNCNFCGKEFYQRKALLLHKRMHSNNKMFQCDICDKRFPVKQSLLQHAKGHNRKKWFDCDICHQKFAHKYNMVRHREIHSV